MKTARENIIDIILEQKSIILDRSGLYESDLPVISVKDARDCMIQYASQFQQSVSDEENKVVSEKDFSESFVKLTPATKGYFLQIGTDNVKHSWAISQDELERLIVALKKYGQIFAAKDFIAGVNWQSNQRKIDWKDIEANFYIKFPQSVAYTRQRDYDIFEWFKKEIEKQLNKTQ